MLTMPFEQVDYQLMARLAEEITGKSAQGKGLMGKLLTEARHEYQAEFHADPEPISDRTLATMYAAHARPEVGKFDSETKGLGRSAYKLLYEYLVARGVIAPIKPAPEGEEDPAIRV